MGKNVKGTKQLSECDIEKLSNNVEYHQHKWFPPFFVLGYLPQTCHTTDMFWGPGFKPHCDMDGLYAIGKPLIN